MVKISSNYKDITSLMFKYANPKSNNITHAKKFISDSGEIFVVDGKRNGTFFDINSKDYKDSKKCAQLLRKTFGGKIELQPIVNSKNGISTCDLKWSDPYSKNFEKWDLKTIEGNKYNTLDSMIKRKRKQSHNFIFDLKNNTLSIEEVQNQIINIFNNKCRGWIETIILKDKDKFLFIYKRK